MTQSPAGLNRFQMKGRRYQFVANAAFKNPDPSVLFDAGGPGMGMAITAGTGNTVLVSLPNLSLALMSSMEDKCF